MDSNRRYAKEDFYRKEQEEILAFGYSCKLFRDDEKAQDIDNGIHLIPCISDPTLMIDRFDVRGALSNLIEAEAKGNEIIVMTEAQELEEKACEYESFCDYPVYNNYNDEERIYNDEEQRRLQIELSMGSGAYAYNQTEFSYGETNAVETNEEQKVDSRLQVADVETFAPSADLHLPEGMDIPKTIRQHKIIMKTSKFVAGHGAQMEIVLMTKQAGNPSFNFMSFDNLLNPYYKHIINLIKTGRLKFNQSDTDTNKDSKENNFEYHIPQVTPDLTPGATSTPKPSTAHCTYSNLISKIREKQKASGVEESEIYSPSTPSSPVTYAGGVAGVKEKAPTVTAQSSSGLPIVGLVDYPSFNQTAGYSSEEDDSSYGLKSSTIGIEPSKVYDYNKMCWPTPELQMVIDKLACYIVKNGPAFRQLVQNRMDSRFDFLNTGHEYNPYFQCKLQLYSEVYGDTFNHQQKGSKSIATPSKSNSIQRAKYSAKGRAISFSIKSKEVEAPLSSNSTFPVESSTSDEDMDDEERDKRRTAREQKRLERKQKEEKARKERESLLLKERSKKQNTTKTEEAPSDTDDLYDIFTYAQTIAKEETSNIESPEKTQSKQMERKMKAAAFLGTLRKDCSENGGPPVYGPHLPVILKLSEDIVKTEESASSSCSTPMSNNTTRVKNSESPAPSVSEDSSGNWLVKEISKSPKQQNDKMNFALSPLIGELPEETTECSGPVSPKEEWSRSRHKKSRKRSHSRSPDRHRERRKRKKSHSSHRKKRRHSRSRSRDRSKAHRSSHKKRKHDSHKEKSKSKRKKHRKYRSPSLSSLSSESTTKATSDFPSDSDSEVQVISPNKVKQVDSSRSSSVLSVSEVTVSNVARSGGESSSTEVNSGKANSPANNDSMSIPPIALSLATGEETSSSLSDIQDSDRKSSFNPSKSNAMAKITEGLRAKLHAMLQKDANV